MKMGSAKNNAKVEKSFVSIRSAKMSSAEKNRKTFFSCVLSVAAKYCLDKIQNTKPKLGIPQIIRIRTVPLFFGVIRVAHPRA